MEKRSDKLFCWTAIGCFLMFGGFELYRYLNYYIRPVGWVNEQTGVHLVFETILCAVTVLILVMERKLIRYLPFPWYVFCAILMYWRPAWDTTVVGTSVLTSVTQVALTLLVVLFFFSRVEKKYNGKNLSKWLWFVSLSAQVLGTACAVWHPGRIGRSYIMYQFGFSLALHAWMAATMPTLKKVAKLQVWVALAATLAFAIAPWASSSNPEPELYGWVVVVLSYARFAILGLGVLMCSIWLWLKNKHNPGWPLDSKYGSKCGIDSIEIPEDDIIVVVDDE